MKIEKLITPIIFIIILFSAYSIIVPNAQTASENLASETTTFFSLCFQESANTTNQTGLDGNCSLDYSGSYGSIGNWLASKPVSQIYDGNYSSSGLVVLTEYAEVYINYTKPVNALPSSLWRVKINFSQLDDNYSIPLDCFNADKLQFAINSYVNPSNLTCYNDTDWVLIKQFEGGNYYEIWEDSMYWNISTTTIGNDLPLRGLFGSNGIIFIIVISMLLIVIVRSLLKK